MLTRLRESSQNFLIFVLFGMLIFVFIFFFGPQSEGFRPGGEQSNVGAWAARVDGVEISAQEADVPFRRQVGFGSDDLDEAERGRMRRESLLQTIDLVAVEKQARLMGLAIGDDDLTRYIVSEDNPDYPLFLDQRGRVQADRYSTIVGQLFSVSPPVYRRIKEREVIVDRYLRFLSMQVTVSEREVKEAYEQRGRTWNLEYVAFDPADFAEASEGLTEADGKAFAADPANTKAIEAYYNDNRHEYDREKEIKIRRVFVRVPKDDEAGAKAAREKVEALHARAKAEGADFAAIASEGSEGYYKAMGGDMGWQTRQNSSPDDYEVYAKLAAGQVSDIIERPTALYFAKAEEVKEAIKRPLAEAREEIGLIVARQTRQATAARKAAEQGLARVRSGAPLSELLTAPELKGDDEAEEAGSAEKEGGDEAAADNGVQVTGPFSEERPVWGEIPGIGNSVTLARKVAGLTEAAPLVDEVIEADDRFFVVRLRTRVEPDAEAYAKERDRLALQLRSQRMGRLMGNWRAVLFGPLRQRAMFRQFGGGALLDTLPTGNGMVGVQINETIYPGLTEEARSPKPAFP